MNGGCLGAAATPDLITTPAVASTATPQSSVLNLQQPLFDGLQITVADSLTVELVHSPIE